MTRFVTQQEPLISLSDRRASSHAREHEDQGRRTQLRKPITSVPLTSTGAGKQRRNPLFWAPNELPEVHFEFPFNLIGKSTMAFLTAGQSWRVLKFWYTG